MKVKEDLFNHNVFIAYRGFNKNADSTSYDSRYIGLALYYELSRSSKIDPFFAPICYGQGDNFLTNIDSIMATVVTAIIVTSNDMFDKIVSYKDENNKEPIVNKNDPLYRELQAIFTSKNIMNRTSERRNANIFLINASRNYSIKTDPKFKIVYDTIINDYYKDTDNITFDEILGIISKNFEENSRTLFIDLKDRIESCIFNFENNKDNSLYTNRFVKRLEKMGSATKAFEELIYIIDMTLRMDEVLKNEGEYVKEFWAYLTINDAFDMEKFRKEIEQWVNEISTFGHMASIKDLYTEKFDDSSISLKEVLAVNDQDEASTRLKEFQESMKKRNEQIGNSGRALLSDNNAKGKNILVYSSSSSATKFVMGISGFNAKRYNIFVAECRIKSSHPFKDGIAFASTITNSSKKIIITDNTALQMIRKKEIGRIVLGACFVKTKDGILQEIVNTSGSEPIVDLANTNDIPVFVVCNTSKEIPDDYNDHNKIEETIVNGFVIRERNMSENDVLNYKAITDLSCIKDDHLFFYETDYEKFKRYPNVFFVSEKGVDNKLLTDYFDNDINKDKRRLDNIDANTVRKYLDCSYLYEKEFLSAISGRVECVPEVLRFDDNTKTIDMKRIKGIRVFELFVALDKMGENDLINTQEIKKSLINRCRANQTILIKELTKWQKDTKLELSVYTKTKIVDLILVLYQSLLIYYPEKEIDIEKETLENEANLFYNDYVSKNKNQTFIPFRDSTIKNMILECEELEGYDQIETQEDLLQLVEVLKNKLTEDPDFIQNSKLYDFDFSTIHNTVSKYDDIVGLFMHERTFSFNNLKDIINKIERMNSAEEEKREFAEAMIVRYIRFGGRKRLYRLIAPGYHKIRFKYDDERFYFHILADYVEKLVPKFFAPYPSIKKLFNLLAEYDNKDQSFDLYKYSCLHEGKPMQKAWIGTLGSKKNNV